MVKFKTKQGFIKYIDILKLPRGKHGVVELFDHTESGVPIKLVGIKSKNLSVGMRCDVNSFIQNGLLVKRTRGLKLRLWTTQDLEIKVEII